MENNEEKKLLPKPEKETRKFGFTALKTTEEKLEEAQKPEIKKIVEGGEEKSPFSIAAERMKAMQQHKLISDMVTVSGPIEYEKFELLGDILKEYKREERYKDRDKRIQWSQKMLVARYVLECLERDKKKFKI